MAGECKDISNLYAVVLKMLNVICLHVGIELTSVEVEEQEPQSKYTMATPYWSSEGTTTTLGADNT
jgi:hypothetical protein